MYHKDAFKGHLRYPMWDVMAEDDKINYGLVSLTEAKEIAFNYLMDFPDVEIKFISNYNDQVYLFDKRKGFVEITGENYE